MRICGRIQARRLFPALVAALLSFASVPAFGQFRLAHVPDGLTTSQRFNLFLSIEDGESFEGAYVAIPAGWRLEKATLLDGFGRPSKVSVRNVSRPANRRVLIPGRPMSARDRLILTIRTGELSGAYRFSVTPFTTSPNAFDNQVQVLDALALRGDLRVDEARRAPDNRVLDIENAPAEPLVAFNRSPGGAAPFTIELWFRTTSTNAVVMTTWDGDERSSYPFELMVNDAGQAVFYRGMPGEHRSMRSAEPVADGEWHHVAATHDPAARWSRLYVDGAAVDSIFQSTELRISDPAEIVLAGRPVARRSDAAVIHSDSFIGMMDEIRVWETALDGASIRRDMRRPMKSRLDVTVRSFEDEAETWGGPETASMIVGSDLSFYAPIRGFEVHLDPASVLLRWQAPDPNAIAFVVERGTDGVGFEEIGRLDRSEKETFEGESPQFEFRDGGAVSGVTFYRIRQVFADGMESVSRSLKVGLGSEDQAGLAALLGNYPNPFNPTTTIDYVLREPQQVQVSVWDLSGQMVSLLVDESQDAGEHRVQFDAKDLPSGTYFVRMRTADGVRSHQIILMK